MKDVNSALKRLEETLNTNIIQNDILNFNVYFTPISVHLKKHEDLKLVFERIKSKFESITETTLQFKFSIIPSNVPGSLSILEQLLHKSYKEEPENIFINTLKAYTAITCYSLRGPLEQKLVDYEVFLESESNALLKGLKCILHEFEDYSLNKVHGAAIKNEPYSLVSISRPNKTLVKHILHETFHCLNARHTYLPFNIMYPTANSILSSSIYLDPFSKKTIKKSINKYL